MKEEDWMNDPEYIKFLEEAPVDVINKRINEDRKEIEDLIEVINKNYRQFHRQIEKLDQIYLTDKLSEEEKRIIQEKLIDSLRKYQKKQVIALSKMIAIESSRSMIYLWGEPIDGYNINDVFYDIMSTEYVLRRLEQSYLMEQIEELKYINKEIIKRHQIKERDIEKIKKRRRYIPKKVKREVFRRDQGRCVNCGSKINLEYDHIIPFSLGGSNTAKNIQLLCAECNRTKYNDLICKPKQMKLKKDY